MFKLFPVSQVEQMVRRNGGFHLLRDEETHGRDVREQEKTEMKLSAASDTKWSRSIGGKPTQINSFDKHTVETGSDGTIERRLINGLQSQQRECVETDTRHTPLEKSLSFKLNKGADTNQMTGQTHESHSADPEVSNPVPGGLSSRRVSVQLQLNTPEPADLAL